MSSPGKLYFSVDPGKTGAFAVLNPDCDIVALEDLPITQSGTLAWVSGLAFLARIVDIRKKAELIAIVERVHAMPENGAQAGFSQGCTLSSILATLQIARVPIEWATPQKWKRDLGLITKRDVKLTDTERKRLSLDKARLLFPKARRKLELQKSHNRAEALLIGYWYLQSLQPRSAPPAPESPQVDFIPKVA